MHSIYSVVTATIDEGWNTVERQRSRVEAYLYSHTTVSEVVTGPRFVAFVLRTEADTESRCDYVARYQVERLRTGFGASTAESHGKAVERAMELTDARLVEQA